MIDIKQIIMDFLRNEDVKIFLFGSRARNDNKINSDYDIGYIPGKSFDRTKITLLKDKFENMNIPYKVELVNFNEVNDNFKENAMKDAVIWKD